jgi:hypothetical protein
MKRLQHILIVVMTWWVYGSLCAQSNLVQTVSFPDCDAIHIDLDSLREQLSNDLTVSLIIFRAESSTNPSGIISPLSAHLGPYDPAIIKVISFEKKHTSGAEFCLFHYTLHNEMNSTKATIPRMFLTSGNQDLMRHILSSNPNLAPVKGDTLFLQLILTRNKEDFFMQVNEVIKQLNNSFILNYFYRTYDKNRVDQQDLLRALKASADEASRVKGPFRRSGFSIGTCLQFPKTTFEALENHDINVMQHNTFGLGFTARWSSLYAAKRIGLWGAADFERQGYNLISKADIVDTLSRPYVDRDGDEYFRIVYAKDVREDCSWESFGLMTGLSIAVLERDRWDINAMPGIRVAFPLRSDHHATGGSISFGAVYPALGQDTIFSGMYGNLMNIPVNTDHYSYQMTAPQFSVIMPLQISVRAYKNIDLSVSGYYLFAFTELMHRDKEKMLLSENPDVYHSLLYRYGPMKSDSYGIWVGIHYTIY